LLTLAASLAAAEPNPRVAPGTGAPAFALVRATLDAGGGPAQGGDFVLHGTIGQADADRAPALGGAFSLTGGYWTRASALAPAGAAIFSNGFEGS
jgi:hypothetical protein